jgi:hypothetical protein
MKKLIYILLVVIFTASCAGTPAGTPRIVTAVGETGFYQVIEREWVLTEVRINGERTAFNRAALIADDFGDVFTLSFTNEVVSGVGAPNLYSAPYRLGEDRSIRIMMMRSTLMAAFREPEHLREHTFFQYMQNVYEWNLVNSKLELLSKTEDGDEVVLVFSAN